MSGTTFPAFASVRRLPNLFDIAAMLCIGGLIFAFASGARHTVAPLTAMEPISLDPAYLPGYALRTTLRMFAALACSHPVHLYLCNLGGEEPPGRQGPGTDPGHPAIGADHRLPHLHRRLLHAPVPRPGAGC